MKQKIILLGCSGTIGKQTLELIENNNNLEIIGVSVFNNIDFLNKIICKFKSIKYVWSNNSSLINFKNKNIEIKNNILDLLDCDFDIIVNAISGFAGLEPTLKAITKEKKILLANKESIVTGSFLIKKIQEKYKKSIIYPIDSEHAAIYQLLKNEDISQLKKIMITASGGIFYHKNNDELKNVTASETLKHPNWIMGKKISIDSATMFNKAFELIEAGFYFPNIDIDIVVQEQSYVHGMIEFNDGSIKMIMSKPDMKSAINYFLNDQKFENYENQKTIDFKNKFLISFEAIDEKKYEAITLAKICLKSKNSKAIALNSANEVCVDAYLNNFINFLDIKLIVKNVFNNVDNVFLKTYEEIKKFHSEITSITKNEIKKINKNYNI